MNTILEPVRDESHRSNLAAGPAEPKDLSHLIPIEDWEQLLPAIQLMRERELRFALGGGFAFSAYSDRCRSTKDLDIFVRPKDRDAFIRALDEAGFEDYFEQKEYDRSWIYRGCRAGAILDVIWEMANHRAAVDDRWLSCGRCVRVHGVELPVLPLEELFWAKLYVLQHDRTDWTDLLNLLYFESEQLDWDRLLERVGPDCELVGAVVSVFRWMCPDKAGTIPDDVYFRLGLWPEAPPCSDCDGPEFDRVRLLDSREWFGPEKC